VLYTYGMTKCRTLLDKFFRNSSGEIVLGQSPNVPFWVWVATKILGLFIETGTFADFLDIVGTGALLVWAGLELLLGVNYFRRLLGLIILVFTLMNVFS
jgi:hypothetical protein